MKRNIDSSNDNSDGSKKRKIIKPIPVSKLRKWRLFRNLDINFIKSVRLAFVFGVYDEFSGFLVTCNDDVYALGNQLKPEEPKKLEDFFFYKDPIKVEELCQKSVVDIVCREFSDISTGLAFAAITERGELYTWGINDYGVLGHGNLKNLLAPTLVNSLVGKPVKQVVMSSECTLVLLEDGQVYSWGEILEDECESTPTKIETLSKIKSIAAGQYFFRALQDNGKLYVWGREPGQDITSHVPALLVNVPTFEKIVCGTHQTLALSKKGELFIWGDNEDNQLGLGEECKDVEVVRKPMKIAIEKVSDIAVPVFASSYFNACRAVDGNFYIWGSIVQNGKEGNANITSPLKVSSKSFHELFCDYSEFQETHEAIRWDSFEMDSALQFETALVHQDKHDYSNVVFVAEGKEINACKFFLVLNSEYFATMFSGKWKEAIDNVIKLGEDIRHEVFFALLFYLCSKDIILTKVKDLKDLMSLSHLYFLPALQRDCEIVLKQNVTVENVVEVYLLALESHLEYLQGIQDFAFQFMTENWKEVAKTKTLANLCSFEVLLDLMEAVADL